MYFRTLLFILLVVTVAACETVVDIPIPEGANKPVLNLLMNKDSVMMARVTLSGRLGGSNEMTEIRNAIVNLYENGSFKETLTPYSYTSRVCYRSNTLPKAGATYRVTAAVEGYEEVSGTDQIPDTVKTGEMKMSIVRTDNYDTKASISVQLHDDPAIQNYYRIRIFELNEWVDGNGNPGSYKSLLYFATEDAAVPVLDDNDHSDFYTTDALFNGRSPRFNFKVHVSPEFKKIVVELTSLTYNSYNYLNSFYMAQEKNDDGLSEKVIVYNNIINGLGIIGGVAQRDYVLIR